MRHFRYTLNPAFTIGEVDPRLFGSFVEHMGRAIYTGLYEPDHPTADIFGFRQDVAALIDEIGVTTIRYPGGNFVSGYDWADGVGPVEDRPVRLDLAWGTSEPNTIGTNEFLAWCGRMGIEPMLAVNLGTRGVDDARRLLEYCNHPGGSTLSDLRHAHGFPDPHDVRFWCLGNEMDGPWQIGAKPAREYGQLARETAKALRWAAGDFSTMHEILEGHGLGRRPPRGPKLTLAACGSSNREMSTYGRWEYEVLDECFEVVDMISLHTYFTNPNGDYDDFLGNIDRLASYIDEVTAIADAVAATRRSDKRIMLSLDEWNVWYKSGHPVDTLADGFPEQPALIEEIFDAKDALVIGGALIVMLNRADRLKSACLAQLVNVIAPIMTEPGGPAWKQTIFHPFVLTAKYGRGQVLCLASQSNDTLDVAAIHTSDGINILALNRDPDVECHLQVDMQGVPSLTIAEAVFVGNVPHDTVNDSENDRLAPRPLREAACQW